MICSRICARASASARRRAPPRAARRPRARPRAASRRCSSRSEVFGSSPEIGAHGQIDSACVCRPPEVPILEDVAGGVLVDQADGDLDRPPRGRRPTCRGPRGSRAGTCRRPGAARSSRRRTRAPAFGSGSSAARPSSGRSRSAVSIFASSGYSSPSSSTGPEPVEDLVYPVAGEQADQVVLGREEEARLAGVALAARAATSWLSIRRDSWRSVPQMNRPPSSRTLSASALRLLLELGGARRAPPRSPRRRADSGLCKLVPRPSFRGRRRA